MWLDLVESNKMSQSEMGVATGCASGIRAPVELSSQALRIGFGGQMSDAARACRWTASVKPKPSLTSSGGPLVMSRHPNQLEHSTSGHEQRISLSAACKRWACVMTGWCTNAKRIAWPP